ncbi:hypothetical protein [Bradyrhizobium sp. DASA03007]|uniref:hypothetical protein n=1 Tax=unclassified Bradyrhizobium TaxID=2631580 RepID=UPI003F71AF29
MQTTFEYRSYVISHDGSAFRAQPMDEEPLSIRSKNLLRLTRSIDALWNVLEGKVAAPSWLYQETDVVDLDAASEAMLVVDHGKAVPMFPLGPTVGLPARAAA